MKNSLLVIVLLYSLTSSAQVSITWNLAENQLKFPAYHLASFEIQNDSNQQLEPGWKLYFNTVFLSVHPQIQTEGFKIQHLAGDFFVLKSNEETLTILPGESLTLSYRAQDGFLKDSHAPEGLIFQKKAGDAFEVESYQSALLSSENLQEMAKGTNMPIPSPESIYLKNESISVLNSDQTPPFLPIPKRYSYGENELTFEKKSTYRWIPSL
jgi:hexosaminidase